ncbi:MAG: TonB-dependent receptor [Burkholderiaceae bacterium]|nr:TonB-dependent receptor [Burkholderiaceae bacterium]
MPAVEVVGTTPLPSVGVPITSVPALVQVFKGEEIDETQSLDLTDYLNRHASGVYVNEIQNNPLQPDVNYRGFTASPLLGTPQGLSVYMDGVRMNQPFGDVVNWDLIPRNAISGMQIMPGSNSLFGLNTLGGALSVQTRNGRDNPGGSVQTTLGSNGRKIGEISYGGSKGALDWFVAGTYFDENGWRERSDSKAGNIFGKLGWSDQKNTLRLTYSHAHTDLNGNGLTPQSFLRRDYGSVYTYPDNTKNTSNFLNLQWDHYFNDNVYFSGNAYYRNLGTRTYNGDLNDQSMPDFPGGDGENVLRVAGAYTVAGNFAACQAELANSGNNGEPGEKCTGAINRTSTAQKNAGMSGQFSVKNSLFGKENNYVIGAGLDASRVRFSQSAEFGVLTPERTVIGTGRFADQASLYEVNGVLDDRSAALNGSTLTWSLFGSDTLTLAKGLDLTVSGRYNHVSVRNRDQQIHYVYDPVTASLTDNIDQNSSLSGKHRFSRLNPALGLTYSPSKNLNAYVGYGEGSRVPTPIELGCANPDAPCRLPNSMAGDPPLKQVVSKTWEAGLRGRTDGNLRWHAGVFSTRNIDDIMFVASNTSQGYFDNFGQTRRRGMEAGLSGVWGDLALGVNYTYLDATYGSTKVINGAANSSADADGHITIRKGDTIPLVPHHIVKVFASYRVNERLVIGGDVLALSSSYARGNENNQHQPDGSLFLGSGKVAGYALLNLRASFKINRRWTLFARVNNVFDRRYATAGQLGTSPFSPSTGDYVTDGRRSTSIGETFLSPGAPRSGWVVLRYDFGGK